MDHDTGGDGLCCILVPIHGMMLVGSICWHWGNNMDTGRVSASICDWAVDSGNDITVF